MVQPKHQLTVKKTVLCAQNIGAKSRKARLTLKIRINSKAQPDFAFHS